MIGLIALAACALYFFVARAIYRAIRKYSRTVALPWAAFSVGLPLWFFFGYLLSPNYRQFKVGCETDAGPHIVHPVPTTIPFSEFCHEAKGILPHSGYVAIECARHPATDSQPGGYSMPVRLQFSGDRPGCQVPLRWNEYAEECYESEPIAQVSTPYVWTFAEPVETIESHFFRGILRVTDTKAVLPDGTLIAYNRHYRFQPQGSAVWLGGSSGSSPSMDCKVRPGRPRGLPKLTEMFPPIAQESATAPQ